MKTWNRHFPFCLLFASLLAAMAGSLFAEDNSINWLGDYREALRQSRQTGKPIFLEFRCEA